MALEVSYPSKTREMSIDLARPVISLTDNISTSMSALYSLHAALFSVYEETSPEVLKFIDLKRKIALAWEQWATLLQHCMGFARDYVNVCYSLQSENLAEHIASAGAILMSAQRICREMVNSKLAYEGLVHQFSSLAAGFHSDTLDMNNNSGIHSASAPAQRRKIFQTYPHRNIIEAYVASVRGLQESNTPIRDMSAFWEDHVARLSEIASSGNVIDVLNQEFYFQKEISTWTTFHDTLFRAVESILSSCDASAVSPINQSHQWKKLINRVLPKRKLLPGGPSYSSQMNDLPSSVSSSEITSPEVLQILTNPSKFDVQGITDTMSRVHDCFRALLRRDTLRRNIMKGRFRVRDRLLGQISTYNQSLSDVEEAASLGALICQNIQNLLQSQNQRTIVDEIRKLTLRVSELTRGTLVQYERMYTLLLAEMAMKKAKKANITLSSSLEAPLQDLDSMRSRVLLTHTGNMMEHLIEQQQQFHLYWSHLALDVDHIEGNVAVNTQELSDGWRKQDQYLRAYGNEARDAKQLENVNYTPSEANWFRSLKGLGWKRKNSG